MEPPFLPGQIVEPPYFIDREDEIAKLARVLGDLSENHLVIGQRRIGKTSLLHNVKQKLNDGSPPVRCLFIDCREVDSVRDLCDLLVERTLESYRDDKKVHGWLKLKHHLFKDAIRDLLGRIESIGVKSLEDIFTAYIDLREKTINESELLRRALSFVEEFAKEKDLRIAIVLDEFQELASLGEVVFQSFKSHGERATRFRFLYSGSAVRVLEEIFFQEDSPLYMTAGKTRLHPLGRQEVANFVIDRLDVVGIDVPEEAAERVHRLTGGIPFYVQKLGLTLYLKTLHLEVRSVDEGLVDECFEDMLHELSSEFEARFEYKYGKNQKSILRALSRKSPRRRIEIADAMDKPTGALSADLDQLEKWMEIEKVRRGVYRICDPVFARWLEPGGRWQESVDDWV